MRRLRMTLVVVQVTRDGVLLLDVMAWKLRAVRLRKVLRLMFPRVIMIRLFLACRDNRVRRVRVLWMIRVRLVRIILRRCNI